MDEEAVLIASGSQDGFVRVWKLERQKGNEEASDELRVRKDTFPVGSEEYAVKLETVLAGHEDKVFGVQFDAKARIEPTTPLRLLTASMDKSLIIWRPSEDVWIEETRLGDVGGTTLGFLGAQVING